ncbi:MAG: NAD(P)-dependent oxidoreductase [Comamonas sp.]
MTQVNPKTYPSTPPQKLAFLGLGVMGYPMAGHLALAGHTVTVYNRNPAKSQQWLQDFGHAGAGGHASAATPGEAAAQADMVFCCVGNDDDLRAVVQGPLQDNGERAPTGALARMRAGTVFVDHTTASAQVARELHALAHQQAVDFVDAPVSGGQAGAQNGALTVMCGGDAAAVARAEAVVMAYAKGFARLGESGAGQLAKMVNQICIAGLVQALSEAVAFGQQSGLDMHQVLDVIGKGAAQSWQMDNRGKTMAEGQFNFGFAVDWMRKDLGLVMDEAKRNGARVPVTALVDQFYADVQRMGGGRWDTSSLIQRLR